MKERKNERKRKDEKNEKKYIIECEQWREEEGINNVHPGMLRNWTGLWFEKR